ncbi:MAG TPA: glycosyltransferase 87 family protein [Nocardioides sp.]|nr:glycosyltransferase 87 family protein [Nocardioides sp.]
MDDVRNPVLPPHLTTSIGGPRGRRLRAVERGPLARLAPVVLLLALPLSAAALRQAGCLADGWRGSVPVWRQCSAPVVQAVTGGSPAGGLSAWLGGGLRTAEPVLSAAVTSLLSRLAPGVATGHQRWFLALWVLLTAAVLAGLVVAVGTVRRHPDADPVALALSPVLALTLFRSTDLLPLALAVVALWAWSRDRGRLAGVLAGLALLAGPLAAVVLLAMALLPGRGGVDGRRRLLVTTAVTVAAVAVPVALLDAGALTGAWRTWRDAGAGPGSPWYLFTMAGFPIGAGHVALIAALGLGLTVALVVLATRSRPRPVVAAASLVGLCVALCTAASFQPWAALWLVPFVALVGIGWRDHLVWAGAEAVHAVAMYGYLDHLVDPAHGLPPGWYAAALLLRLAAVAWLGREAWVRASWGDAAPAGTLWRLPSARPVENPTGGVGSSAYPPVTEGP